MPGILFIVLKISNVLSLNLNDGEEEQLDLGSQLVDFFIEDEAGNIVLNVDSETLQKELGLTAEEADELLQINEYFENQSDMQEISQRGFVGVRVNLGPETRAMNALLGGAYVTGWIGFHLKVFATTPATAGAVAVISAGIGFAIKTVIQNKIKTVQLGINVPGISLSKTLTTK